MKPLRCVGYFVGGEGQMKSGLVKGKNCDFGGLSESCLYQCHIPVSIAMGITLVFPKLQTQS